MISIIVPFYCTNKEYFDKCMTSLLADRDADIEVLVVDDGSPDEYKGYFSEYTADSRVRVFSEDHKGVSNARNVGIRESKGDWLMFVDSDDYLEKDYYKRLEPLTHNSDTDLFYFNGFADRNGLSVKNKFFVKENIDYAKSLEEKCKVMGSGLSLGRTPEYLRCFYTLGSPCSKLINTNFIRKNRIFFDPDVKFGEDTLFSLELILKADHIYYSDVYLYHYYMNTLSVTGKYREGLSDDVDFFFKKVSTFLDENGIRAELEESYHIRGFLEAQRCIRQEFYHKENPKSRKDRHKAAMSLIEREPYRTGLRARYPYMKTKASAVAAGLLRRGQFNAYMRMYDALAFVKRLAKKS